MCVEILRTGLVFARQSIWGVTCLCLLSKWMFSHLSSWQLHKCVLKSSEQVLFLPRQLIWGVTCLGLLWRMNVLPIYLLGNCLKMCVETSEQGSFFKDDQFERSHAYVYSQNECFPIYLLGNPKNVCWNPQNRACFCRTIDLRGHMPRFTLKMNVLLSISLCWNPRTGLVFPKLIWVLKPSEEGWNPHFLPRQSIWGVTCLGLL